MHTEFSHHRLLLCIAGPFPPELENCALCDRNENSSAFRGIYKFRGFHIQSLRRCVISCVVSFTAVIPSVQLFRSSTKEHWQRPLAQIESERWGWGEATDQSRFR
ncbi:hypothetical protein NPIL_248411 [Nephila pilipes]|uniref:Uncharacterized protein n=1 Tax=Nephila pilipes TaxID=299642 RepID=A0A8X6Q9S9_NEPPI|nr:hypothetical protein NPIL_248411 [Nephila pilipes]